MEMSGIRKNILLNLIHRNGGVTDAKEYFGQVGTSKWRCQGCKRTFWLSRHAENGGVRDGKEYFG